MTFLQFADKSVPYGVFVKDVAAEVVHLLKRTMPTPTTSANGKPLKCSGAGT